MNIDAELIKDCIRDVLSERASVDPETHKIHHETLSDFLPQLSDFLAYRRMRMAQLKKRQENWEKITNTAVGVVVVSVVTAVIGVLAWVGSLVVQAFIHWVHAAPTGGG